MKILQASEATTFVISPEYSNTPMNDTRIFLHQVFPLQ